MFNVEVFTMFEHVPPVLHDLWVHNSLLEFFRSESYFFFFVSTNYNHRGVVSRYVLIVKEYALHLSRSNKTV